MRTLNRPMFRYGGPIKEGVMSGIREPKKNGGLSKQFGTGLVGDERYPKTGGREHHLAVLPFLGLNALRTGAMALGRRSIPKIANFFRTQVGTKSVPKQGPTFTMPGKTTFSKGYSGTVPGRTITPGTGQAPVYAPNFLGRDPTVRLIGGTYKAVTSPTSKGILGKGARLVFSPTGLVTGAIYAGGKFFDSDGNEIKNAEEKGLTAGDKVGTSGAPGGGDPGMRGDGSFFAAEAEKEALAKEQKDLNNRIQRYRDIMDIKGMNKQAAYKSLIDASKLVQESGDFKGDIKSGKLINQLIQATSKRFDKPVETSKAVDTLILQNELKKDLDSETKALDKAYKESAIALNQAKLAENSLAGDIRAYTAKNQTLPSGSTLAGYAKSRGIDIESVASTTEVKNWMTENGKTEIEFLQEVIQNNPGNVKPGNHVINDKIFTVSEDMQITGQKV